MGRELPYGERLGRLRPQPRGLEPPADNEALLPQSHPPQQGLKPRIIAHRVVNRLNFQHCNCIRVLFIRLLQPSQRFFPMPHPHVCPGQWCRSYGISLVHFFQSLERLARLLLVSPLAIHPCLSRPVPRSCSRSSLDILLAWSRGPTPIPNSFPVSPLLTFSALCSPWTSFRPLR